MNSMPGMAKPAAVPARSDHTYAAESVSAPYHSSKSPSQPVVDGVRGIRLSRFTVDYLLIDRAERRPLNAPSSRVDGRLADLDQLTDEERTTITNVIDALVTKAKLRLITGGAG